MPKAIFGLRKLSSEHSEVRALVKEVAQLSNEALSSPSGRAHVFPFHSVTTLMAGTQLMGTQHEGVCDLLNVILGMKVAKDSQPLNINDVMNALRGLNRKRFEDDRGKDRVTRYLVSLATRALEDCPDDPSGYNQGELIKAMGFLRGMISGERVLAEDTACLARLLNAVLPALLSSPSADAGAAPTIRDVALMVSGLRHLNSKDVHKFMRAVKSHVRSSSGFLDRSVLFLFLAGFESKSTADKATQSLLETIMERYDQDSAGASVQSSAAQTNEVRCVTENTHVAETVRSSVSLFIDAVGGVGGIASSSPQFEHVLSHLLQAARSLKTDINSCVEALGKKEASVAGDVSHSSFVLAFKGLRRIASTIHSSDANSIAAITETLSFLLYIGSHQEAPLHPLACAAVLSSVRGLMPLIDGDNVDSFSGMVEALCDICTRSESYISGLREAVVPCKIDKESNLTIAIRRPSVTNSDLRLLREIINLLVLEISTTLSSEGPRDATYMKLTQTSEALNRLNLALDKLLQSLSVTDGTDGEMGTLRETYLRVPFTHAEAGYVKARRLFTQSLDEAFRKKGAAYISVVKAKPNIGNVYFTDVILCDSSRDSIAVDLKSMLHPALFSKKNTGYGVTNIVLNIETPDAVYSMPNYIDFTLRESEKQTFILNLIKKYNLMHSDGDKQTAGIYNSTPYISINVRNKDFMELKTDAVSSEVISALELLKIDQPRG